MTYQLVLLTKSFPYPHARVLSFRVFGYIRPRRRVLGCIYSKRRFYLGIFVFLSLACSAQSTISNDHSVAVLRTDCDTYRNTRGRRSRQAEIDLKDYDRFFPADIIVGFEQTSYDVVEGEEVNICVEVISPPDIGSTEIYVEVIAVETTAENRAS